MGLLAVLSRNFSLPGLGCAEQLLDSCCASIGAYGAACERLVNQHVLDIIATADAVGFFTPAPAAVPACQETRQPGAEWGSWISGACSDVSGALSWCESSDLAMPAACDQQAADDDRAASADCLQAPRQQDMPAEVASSEQGQIADLMAQLAASRQEAAAAKQEAAELRDRLAAAEKQAAVAGAAAAAAKAQAAAAEAQAAAANAAAADSKARAKGEVAAQITAQAQLQMAAAVGVAVRLSVLTSAWPLGVVKASAVQQARFFRAKVALLERHAQAAASAARRLSWSSPSSKVARVPLLPIEALPGQSAREAELRQQNAGLAAGLRQAGEKQAALRANNARLADEVARLRRWVSSQQGAGGCSNEAERLAGGEMAHHAVARSRLAQLAS